MTALKNAPEYALSVTISAPEFGRQVVDLSDGKGNPARFTVIVGNTAKTSLICAIGRASRDDFSVWRALSAQLRLASTTKADAPKIITVDDTMMTHPLKQRVFLAGLVRRFPLAQFIISTNSPFVVQSAGPDANILHLRRPKTGCTVIKKMPPVSHLTVGQILTSDLFGLPSTRAPEHDEKYMRRRELLRKKRPSKEERYELATLEAWIAAQPGGETPEEMATHATLRSIAGLS